MKKLITTILAAFLVSIMLSSTVSAAEIIIPGQNDTNPPQAPVIAASQNSTAAPAENTPAAQTPAAEVFTTPDGVLSIEMPLDTVAWSVVQDPDSWFTLSNGTDKITAVHLANGDPLPAAHSADSAYAEVFEVQYSTVNEVFIITGYVKDTQKMPAVRNAVCSFKVLKYDTLQKKEVPAAPQVRDASEVLYSIQPAGVNVRSNANTSSEVIGGIVYGEQINVTGYVIENGAETGWLRINFNGKNGYVHGSNFSRTQPPERTGNSIDLFAPEGGGVVVTVYELTDGRYMDNNGHYYTKVSDTEYINDNDEKWVLPEYFDNNPIGQNFLDFTMDMIDESTGEMVTVRGLTQGGYINESTGVIYQQEGGGGEHLYGNDGSVLVFPEVYSDTGDGEYEEEYYDDDTEDYEYSDDYE